MEESTDSNLSNVVYYGNCSPRMALLEYAYHHYCAASHTGFSEMNVYARNISLKNIVVFFVVVVLQRRVEKEI